jgi:hypothetical protein
MNQKKTLSLNKKIIIFLFINTFFLTHGLTLRSFLEKTDNNIGHKTQTIIGPFVLYYGFYQLWEKWKKIIEESNVGDDTKNILTLGLKGPNKNALNYAIPLAAIILMPRVNIQDGLHLYSNLFKTLVTTLNTTKP